MAGTIRKRKDGGWLVDHPMHGERVRQSAADYPEAQRKLEALRAAAAEYTGYAALESVLQNYLGHVRVRRKKNTVRAAEYHAGWLREGLGVACNAAQLKPAEITRFVEARKAQGAPVSTINAHLRILRAACNHAVEDGILKAAPRVKLMREPKVHPTIVETREQLEALFAKASPAVRLALSLAAFGGLRHAEIMHLRGEDIDLDAGVLYVRGKKWQGGEWSPKSHADRDVPINRLLRKALEGAPRQGWLFPGRDGQPRNGLYAEVRSAFRGAGMYSARPGLHKLRRTFASWMLAAGADVNTVRTVGGWADLVTTQRYLFSSDDSKRRAVALLDGADDGGDRRGPGGGPDRDGGAARGDGERSADSAGG